VSVERRGDDEHIMLLSFSEGSGAGWGLRSYEEAAEELGQKVRKNLEVIEAMYQLEHDYTSERWFQELQKALREAFRHTDSREIRLQIIVKRGTRTKASCNIYIWKSPRKRPA